MHPTTIQYTVFETNWGWAGFATTDQGLCCNELPQAQRKPVESLLAALSPEAQQVPNLRLSLKKAIQHYFAGQTHDFDEDLSFDLTGFTPFAQAVLQACCRIPPGQTQTYGQLAQAAGSPKAARAVGGVMARNPLPLLIPCHRVIASTGHLTGFSGPGGLTLKKRLLDHESQAVTHLSLS